MSTELIPWVAAIIVAGAVGLVVGGISSLVRPDPVRARLNEYITPPRSLEEMELQLPFRDRVLRPLIRSVSAFLVRRTPQQSIERLRKDLLLAGSPGGLDVADFLGVQGIVTLLLGALGVLLAMRSFGFMPGLLGGGACGALGYVAPRFWLRSRIDSRRKQITRALPDALDLLVISVEAGLGFDAALQKVVEKWDNTLTREFGRALSEMRVGSSRRDALRGIAERTDAPDVNAFVGAIIQADQLGVSIGRVLLVQANQMRIRRRQRAEELAHKAPIKMLFPMVLLIFPAMYIVILGPAIPAMVKGFGME